MDASNSKVTPYSPEKIGASSDTEDLKTEIVKSLGMYRAEYSEQSIAQIFARPLFWNALSDRKPAFLIGGRGTGKTVALRMLAFDGQHELAPEAPPSEWPVFGFYWRLSVLALSAFKGEQFTEEDWIRVFSHWVNLQLVDRILQFLIWRHKIRGEETVTRPNDIRRVAKSIGVDPTSDPEELRERILDHLAEFQSAINGVGKSSMMGPLSMLGEPLKLLLDALADDPAFSGRWITICLDEFENLQDYQQRVFNSLIKHVGDSKYTLKIGVKPRGLRDRHTLNEHESIGEVADYTSVEIVRYNKEHEFSDFAARVCIERFGLIPESARPSLGPIEMFPEISEEDEANLLGVRRSVEEIRSALLEAAATIDELSLFDKMSGSSAHLVGYLARCDRKSPIETLRDAIARPQAWANRMNNYGYASLFTIRDTSSGPQLRKFYAGWSTLILLADGNIRYLLDLVSSAFITHVEQGFDLSVPIDPTTQTRAAMAVGRKLVLDLEGQDNLGKQILLLVHGIGRVFGVMARQPWGHTPEVNQFRIAWKREDDDTVDQLLSASVMNSALVPFEGDKRAAFSGETREYDYQLHPIFSPYFEYSHRRKRRMTISSADIRTLAHQQSTDEAIARLLKSQKRTPDVVSSDALFDWTPYG